MSHIDVNKKTDTSPSSLFPAGNPRNAFIDAGFKAVVTCVDSRRLSKDFAGRTFDRAFMSDLPPHVDPCGENGEFYSFACAGPIFRHEIPASAGEVALRDEFFYFCDITAA